MSKKKKQKKAEMSPRREISSPSWHTQVHPEIKKIAAAIIFFVTAGIFILSYLEKGGAAGRIIFTMFNLLLGKGYVFAPLTFVLIGISLVVSGEHRIITAALIGGIMFLVSILAGLHVVFGAGTGGFIGSLIGTPAVRLFDVWASILIVAAMIAISLLLILNVPFWRREDEKEDEGDVIEQASAGVKAMFDNINTTIKSALEKKSDDPAAVATAALHTEDSVRPVLSAVPKDEASIAVRKIARKFDYKKPPLELLQGDRGKPSSGDIRANSNIIKRTLENFGIIVEMGEVAVGPTVTQYTLRPAEGVKLARITALHNDLSLSLAAHPIRIEAPIPGKSLVGIEVPNKSIALVGLRALLEQDAYTESAEPLWFALGRDVTGAPVFADLARMPHLLVSGATGSGKSVCMHSIMASFIYRNPPELLRFIIVDPKRVELSIYNDIPHLLTPVITDPKVTIQALRWASREMDRRYEMLSLKRCRDIASYNSTIVKAVKQGDDEEGPELMAHIVILIDELADIMMAYPREVESSIVRLAQMARAVGVHLLLATQRPSVEVITGLIKANVPSRIAFQVASQIDSRTILDASGAEKLLGNGDMLFLAGDMAKPRRIQGAYVSEQEVKRVVDFLREQSTGPAFDEQILQTSVEAEWRGGGTDEEDNDPLLEEARALVIDAGRASASYLQRRLKVGYARAARLLDLLEAQGVIGPADGAKPREILMTSADFVSLKDGSGEV